MSRSQIFFYFCLSFLAGVFIQSLVSLPFLLHSGILILGIIVVAISWQKNWPIVIGGFCLIILVGGLARSAAASADDNLVGQFNDRGRIVVIGVIVAEPDIRSDKINYRINAREVNFFAVGRPASAIASGNILVVASKYPLYRYGDKIEIAGELKTPSAGEDFHYRQYLAKDDIFSVIYQPSTKLLAANQGSRLMAGLLSLKNRLNDSIDRILTEPSAAFLAGLLLGEKRGLPSDLTAAFSRTGTAHLIALSGYNITIIASVLMSFFCFFAVRRQIGFWLSVGVIVLFVLMTGAAASAARAAIMGILVLLARQIGRLYQAQNALIFAGALMVCLSPKILTWDLGFQLSFAAALGLIYVLPIFQRWFALDEREELKFMPTRTDESRFAKLSKSAKLILATTLAAQAAVLPLLVVNFGQLSLIAPLANILILPAIPLTMLVGFLGILGNFIFSWLGQAGGWLVWLLLIYEIKIIELMSKIPLAAIDIKWTWLGGGIYYAILIWLVWRFNKKQKSLLRNK